MIDRSPGSPDAADLILEGVALDHLPDLQRAAVAFIDLQLAHLDAQRGRLLKAREVLVGPAVVTTETQKTRPVPAAIPVAVGANGHHARNGDHKPPASHAPTAPAAAEPDGRSLADRIEEYIREHGPTSCHDIAAGLGCRSSAVYRVVSLDDTTGRFVRDGFGRWSKWDVRRSDRVA